MIMGKKISIIVPTYNVEKYVSKCLDSLVNQDYKNYDVIVVNDGSPYNEQAIIDQYVAKYPNIVKCIKKENGGYGSALEVGFKQSDAEYVVVCDSDDYLASNALSTLMNYRDEYDADLVVGAKNLVFSDNNEVKYDCSYNSNFGVLKDNVAYLKSTKEFEALYFLEPSPHSKMYKRSVVLNIVFPHKVGYTDNLLYFYALNKAKKVVYCEKPLSYYLVDRKGNTSTDLKPSVIDARVKVFKNILSQVKNADEIFYYRMFEAFYYIYYMVDDISGDEKDKLEKYDVAYELLEGLIPYKESILKMNSYYNKDTDVMLKQKNKLLTPEKSRKMYNQLVKGRLNKTIKQKIKNIFLKNRYLRKLINAK